MYDVHWSSFQMGFIKPKPKLSLRVNPKRKDNPMNETQQVGKLKQWYSWLEEWENRCKYVLIGYGNQTKYERLLTETVNWKLLS